MTRLLMALAALCGTAHADEVSFVNEGVIEAPIEEVWKVFATSEGYKVLGPALQITPQSFPFKNAWRALWAAMRHFFEAGNQSVIENVQRHFAAGSAR